jgi:hypothetical protein
MNRIIKKYKSKNIKSFNDMTSEEIERDVVMEIIRRIEIELEDIKRILK